MFNINRAQLLAKFESHILDLTIDHISGNVDFPIIDDGSINMQSQCINNKHSHSHKHNYVHVENHDVFVLPIIEHQVFELSNTLNKYLSNLNECST